MKEIFNEYGIEISKEQEKKLKKYYELLIEYNKNVNLTNIVEYDQVVLKHFLDSALVLAGKKIREIDVKTILDIGTGAGFPGMVLAIFMPDSQITLVDSLNKRIEFLKLIARELEIENVEIYHGRAEDLGRDSEFRNKFDIVVSRAVAGLPILLEYCIPFVKKSGYLISYKGKKYKEELQQAENALNELDSELEEVEKFELKKDDDFRYFLYIKNKENTKDKYPRKAGKQKKKPL